MNSDRSDSAIPTRAATTARSAGGSCPKRSSRRVEELSAAYFEARADEAFLGPARRSAARLRRRGRRRSTKRERLTRVARRRAHLPQARGPRAHRRAQDQQRARAGAAGGAHGEAARRRRDRRGAARRRDRDRLRAARAGVRRLHGRRRHGAPVAQRVPDAAARRDVRRVDAGRADAEGRDQRGDARLGDQRRRQLLPARLGAGPASVSADGARVPVGHRPGGARAVPRRSSAGCPTRSSPASAAAATRWASSTRSSPTGSPADRRRGRRARHRRPASTRRASPAAAPACCRARAATCCRTPDGNVELTHSISAGLDYASVGPEHAWLRDIGRAEYTWIDDEDGAGGVPAAGARGGHPAGARVVARDRARLPARADDADGRDPAGQPVGPRRQGRASASRRRRAGRRAR